MRFIRLEIHDEKGHSSTPYLFCSKCRSFIMNEQFRFCPWCGHEFKKKQVEIVSVDQSELTEKEINFRNIVDYVRGKVTWNE